MSQMGIPVSVPHRHLASNNLNDFKVVCSENGSSQGQNLALNLLCVPYSLAPLFPETCEQLSSNQFCAWCHLQGYLADKKQPPPLEPP